MALEQASYFLPPSHPAFTMCHPSKCLLVSVWINEPHMKKKHGVPSPSCEAALPPPGRQPVVVSTASRWPWTPAGPLLTWHCFPSAPPARPPSVWSWQGCTTQGRAVKSTHWQPYHYTANLCSTFWKSTGPVRVKCLDQPTAPEPLCWETTERDFRAPSHGRMVLLEPSLVPAPTRTRTWTPALTLKPNSKSNPNLNLSLKRPQAEPQAQP